MYRPNTSLEECLIIPINTATVGHLLSQTNCCCKAIAALINLIEHVSVTTYLMLSTRILLNEIHMMIPIATASKIAVSDNIPYYEKKHARLMSSVMSTKLWFGFGTRRGKDLLLGPNSQFNNIPILGSILQSPQNHIYARYFLHFSIKMILSLGAILSYDRG